MSIKTFTYLKICWVIIGFVVDYWPGMDYWCLGMVSNSAFDIFGTFQFSTNFGTSDPLLIAEILQQIRINPNSFSKTRFLQIWGYQMLKMENACTAPFETLFFTICFENFETFELCKFEILKLWSFFIFNGRNPHHPSTCRLPPLHQPQLGELLLSAVLLRNSRQFALAMSHELNPKTPMDYSWVIIMDCPWIIHRYLRIIDE